ncbi:polymeric immunoglobulin receptor-like [Chanodichthys erythropterus]|uniref:polymeric immunoglobulin receptor-like n=1 Tax=Chanodichthys erythropterus TaxID=933992 RepID=UPI00351DDA60
MRDHLYLFFFMIQFSTGCILPDEQQTTRITGYTGGSVVLPCSCAHPQSTVNTFTWLFYGNGKQWIPVFEDEEYSGRRVLFNESSPQNLSLLISDLRQEDQGFYECKTEHDKITITIRLTVKSCNLVQNTEVTIAVTGYAGESVVLPCSCSELLAKPEQIQWMYYVEKAYKEIYPNEKIERHKNRVKLLNQTSPGNLSLYISALTAEDEGDYYCSVSSQKVSYRLYVEGSFVLLIYSRDRETTHPYSYSRDRETTHPYSYSRDRETTHPYSYSRDRETTHPYSYYWDRETTHPYIHQFINTSTFTPNTRTSTTSTTTRHISISLDSSGSVSLSSYSDISGFIF